LKTRPIQILLVEDNPGDSELAKMAFRDSTVSHKLAIVEDGELALAYLRREPPFERAQHPDLVLLDLNLPKLDGKEVLAIIKQDPTLKRIPVVILTTSRAQEDILRAYELHANCYIQKPIDMTQFTRVVRSIEDFWLGTVVLPPEV